jgi:hypothetical protein
MRAVPAALAALLAAPAAAGEGTALLPEVVVRLKAARYEPADQDFRWTGWIGAGVGVLRLAGATAYFTTDVETILGNEKRAFDANQANYHLEGGARKRLGRGELALVFHHVSRHYVDRPKARSVDWNVLGGRGSFETGGRVPARITLGLGHTTQDSLVGYRWEATARLEADLVTRPAFRLYGMADLRGLSVEQTERFPRGGFVDVWVEGGIHFLREGRALDLFAAFERRNDVRIEEPGARDRLLVGGRFGFVTGAQSPPR